MSGKIKSDQLAKAVGDILDEYQETVADKVKKSVVKAANDAVKQLKATSPKRTGKYAKSWAKKVMKESSQEEFITVYAKRYQLTHLLENGHAKRGGGRVAAIPHIKPVEEKVVKQLEEEIEEGVQDG